MFVQLKQHSKTPSLCVCSRQSAGPKNSCAGSTPLAGGQVKLWRKMKNLKAQATWPQTQPCISGTDRTFDLTFIIWSQNILATGLVRWFLIQKEVLFKTEAFILL